LGLGLRKFCGSSVAAAVKNVQIIAIFGKLSKFVIGSISLALSVRLNHEIKVVGFKLIHADLLGQRTLTALIGRFFLEFRSRLVLGLELVKNLVKLQVCLAKRLFWRRLVLFGLLICLQILYLTLKLLV
jgi:hypothetical protein